MIGPISLPTFLYSSISLFLPLMTLLIARLSIDSLLQMQLYNLPLNPSTAIIKTVYGNFTAPKAQEIILVKTKSLELYSISDQGKLQLLIVEELFCVLRTAVAFRYHGTHRDSIAIGSDSGKIVILEYSDRLRRFSKTHEETFGKSGCRRIIPGHYLAVDPKGRAIMIAAIEKQKFVYVMERKEDTLVIHSPREGHKSHSICLDVVSLDTGSDNAMFVCLEMDYGEVEDKESLVNTGGIKKAVVYYEMDFGMNTVIRKKEVSVDPTAHMLIAVPAAPEGPGGLLIVLEDYLLYRSNEDHLIRFPLRQNRPLNRKTQFTCSCIYRFKGFFFLISSEWGDIFKIEFLLKEGKKESKEVVSLKIEYFDSAAPLTSMSLTKNGFLFCAAEKEDHQLYMILKKEGKTEPVFTHSQMAQNKIIEFEPKTEGSENRILEAVDSLEQYGPLTDLKIADLQEEGNPQIYATNASGEGKSHLRIIKQGLKVKELNAIRYHQPQEIWCIKNSEKDDHDRMIILSLVSKTLVLTTTANGYSQTKETGLDEDSPSIHVGRLQDDSLVQILPSGFRHIRTDKTARTMKFEGRIIKGTIKGRQMVIALAGGDIIYYQLDQTGALSEVTQISLDSQVVSFDFSPVEKGRVRSSFLAAALSDFTTRIFELSPDSCLKMLSTQNMRSAIECIAIEEMDTTESETEQYGLDLYLYAGLQNGMIVRTSIDPITGKLTDSRPKYLGAKPVRLVKIEVLGKPAILGLSSRPWLFYTFGRKQMASLLAFPFISVATAIKMSTFSHTIMTFSENHLRIIKLDNFGSIFHCDKIPLDYSAKKLMIFDKKHIAIIESMQLWKETKKEDRTWCSKVSIFHGKLSQKLQEILMDEDEACISMCECKVTENNVQTHFIVVGCVKSLKYHPSFYISQPKIKVYEWKSEENKAVFYHQTELEDIPLVLYAWKDRILAGVGKCLRYYEIGHKRMLRKAEVKNLLSPVNTIKTWGERIYATEINDSFHMYKYNAGEQTFHDIADDVLNRYVTTTAILDYHTMIGADKFENIFVSRVPPNAEEDFENNPNAYKFRWENGYLNGAPFKMEQICNYYVGEVVTSIDKAALATSGSEILIYSTINGGINALCPFESREDLDFFTHLELYMKNLMPSLGGRDHLVYRSYYSPCKAVIDGQMCEVFNKLTYEEQIEIGKHLDRTPQEIQKKLEEIRNKLI